MQLVPLAGERLQGQKSSVSNFIQERIKKICGLILKFLI
jgi:hypothetical protein